MLSACCWRGFSQRHQEKQLRHWPWFQGGFLRLFHILPSTENKIKSFIEDYEGKPLLLLTAFIVGMNSSWGFANKREFPLRKWFCNNWGENFCYQIVAKGMDHLCSKRFFFCHNKFQILKTKPDRKEIILDHKPNWCPELLKTLSLSCFSWQILSIIFHVLVTRYFMRINSVVSYQHKIILRR